MRFFKTMQSAFKYAEQQAADDFGHWRVHKVNESSGRKLLWCAHPEIEWD